MEYCNVNPHPINAPNYPPPNGGGGVNTPSLSPLLVIVENKLEFFHDWRSLPKTSGKRLGSRGHQSKKVVMEQNRSW